MTRLQEWAVDAFFQEMEYAIEGGECVWGTCIVDYVLAVVDDEKVYNDVDMALKWLVEFLPELKEKYGLVNFCLDEVQTFQAEVLIDLCNELFDDYMCKHDGLLQMSDELMENMACSIKN